eukprot:6541024-Alexandrium_andersonii.AAC.1
MSMGWCCASLHGALGSRSISIRVNVKRPCSRHGWAAHALAQTLQLPLALSAPAQWRNGVVMPPSHSVPSCSILRVLVGRLVHWLIRVPGLLLLFL